MRKAEDLLKSRLVEPDIYVSPENDDEIEETPDPVDIDTEDPVIESTPEAIPIPERIITDPEVIGYSDDQSQMDTYRLALTGNFPIVGDVSVCEIGAKRGDLAVFINNNLPLLNLEYTGFEANDLLVDASKIVLERARIHDNCKVIRSSFIDEDFTGQKFDISVITSNLINNPYITNGTKWEFIENLLRKTIPLTNERVILILLHDAGGDDNFLEFPVPNMVDTLLRFNHPFKIDFGKISDMYSVVIDTTTKRFI
jgi:hypothetical protein